MERTGTILTACNVAHRPPLVVRPATLSDTCTRAQETVQPYSRTVARFPRAPSLLRVAVQALLSKMWTLLSLLLSGMTPGSSSAARCHKEAVYRGRVITHGSHTACALGAPHLDAAHGAAGVSGSSEARGAFSWRLQIVVLGNLKRGGSRYGPNLSVVIGGRTHASRGIKNGARALAHRDCRDPHRNIRWPRWARRRHGTWPRSGVPGLGRARCCTRRRRVPARRRR